MADRKVLVVDDEKAIVRLLSMSLRSDGYTPFTAYSGEQALEILSENDLDIIVTDIKMPGMDGLELLQKIKKIDSEKEVIIVTGHGDIDSTITALQYGASDFINKPVRDESLALALERAEAKIDIRQKLNEYTENLEIKVEEATKEIRRKADFQKLLIQSSNDAIVATDSNWKVVTFNPEAERICGLASRDVVDTLSMGDLCISEIEKALKAEAEKESGSKFLPWKETTLVSMDGSKEVPVRFSGSILHEKGQMVGSVTFFHDLTDLKQLEHELVQSEKLAAVGETVSGLAHYIKNILIGLKGGSYVVDVGLKKNNTEKLKAGWSTIKKNINRTSELVSNLLTYSKERKPDYKNCFPNELVEEIVDLFEDTALEKDVVIKTELDPAVGEILIDPATIHRCLLNLLSNGIDACTEDEDLDKEWVIGIKTAVEEKNILTIEVSDNGCGMSQETRDNIYTSFFSTKGGRGTGLGLLVTSKLIQEHGGSIEFTSAPGQGTTFTIRLPFEDIAREKTKEA
ncbi:MAG: response regulator [Desulfobacteraceae bacterium]